MQQVVVRERQAVGRARHRGHRRRQNRAGIEWFIVNPSAGKLVIAGLPRRWPEQPDLSGDRHDPERPWRDGLHPRRRGPLPERRLRSHRRQVGVGDDPRRRAGLGVDDGFTSYKATSATRRGPAGATTGRRTSTATASGSLASTSGRPARSRSTRRRRSELRRNTQPLGNWGTGSARSRRSFCRLIEGRGRRPAWGGLFHLALDYGRNRPSGWLRQFGSASFRADRGERVAAAFVRLACRKITGATPFRTRRSPRSACGPE